MNAGLVPMTRNEPSVSASAMLTRGHATETARVFLAGSEVAPFTVGSHGDWGVIADGVEEQHFCLYFDGQTLFAALSASNAAVSLDGKPLPSRWTELPDGCALVFGAASIAVTNLAKRPKRRSSFPPARSELRGPRILDPFACETLVDRRLSPLAEMSRESSEDQTVVRSAQATLAALEAERELLREEPTVMRSVAGALTAPAPAREPLEQTTLWERPGASDSVLKPLLPPVDSSLDSPLALTLAQPVTAPMAITMIAPMPSVAPRPLGGMAAGPALAGSVTATSVTAASVTTGPVTAASLALKARALWAAIPKPLRHKLIAGLAVAALVLIGVNALTSRRRSAPLKASAAGLSPRDQPVASASAQAAGAAAPGNPDDERPPIVDGKTAERQAVDLIARGAYREAAALYDRLARSSDDPVFREAARIARRKAELAK